MGTKLREFGVGLVYFFCFLKSFRNKHWLMKHHQSSTSSKQLPSPNSKGELHKVVTKFSASIPLQRQHHPPYPQQTHTMLPRKLYLLYRRFSIASISLKGPPR